MPTKLYASWRGQYGWGSPSHSRHASRPSSGSSNAIPTPPIDSPRSANHAPVLPIQLAAVPSAAVLSAASVLS